MCVVYCHVFSVWLYVVLYCVALCIVFAYCDIYINKVFTAMVCRGPFSQGVANEKCWASSNPYEFKPILEDTFLNTELDGGMVDPNSRTPTPKPTPHWDLSVELGVPPRGVGKPILRKHV